MMTLREVLAVHETLIWEFGGSAGVRDFDLLDAAVKRPFATFDQVDLYPSPVEKAAAILESIVRNHPFLDGNKRTGYTLMRLMLLENELDIEASQDEKYEFVIGVASGRMNFEEIKMWIELKLKK